MDGGFEFPHFDSFDNGSLSLLNFPMVPLKTHFDTGQSAGPLGTPPERPEVLERKAAGVLSLSWAAASKVMLGALAARLAASSN